MKTVYVKKDKFGLAYKTEQNSTGWKYFPDSVKSALAMRKYFEEGRHQPWGGKHDPPQLDFRDEKFKPVVYFTVNKTRTFAAADFDSNKRVLIDSKDLATELEIHDFLRPRCAFSLENEVLMLDTLAEKNALLLSKASPEALAELNKIIKTNEAVTLYLSNHAKQNNNSDAIINFEE
jgi:hypothetical protein